MSKPPPAENLRVTTGVSGLDDILGGGLPARRLYLIQGQPGSGKTTLALQFLLEGARRGEKVLYISLSETREEVEEVARSHNWSLADVEIVELSAIEKQLSASAQNTLFHASEIELTETTKLLLDAVEKVKPTRCAFDSLSELRLLSQDALRYRRQILSFRRVVHLKLQIEMLVLGKHVRHVGNEFGLIADQRIGGFVFPSRRNTQAAEHH